MVKRFMDELEVIRLWNEEHYSGNMIANKLGFSRPGVIKCLNRNGIDTSKASKIPVVCANCGIQIDRTKSRMRATNKPYCSRGCYHEAIRNEAYQPYRQGQRIARGKILEVLPLKPGNVVHHKDGDNHNNELDNLMVFRNQADHMSYHRGGDAAPIFKGA